MTGGERNGMNRLIASSKTRTLPSRPLMMWMCVVLISIANHSSAANRPTITITPTAITATDVTPGTDVAFFGVGLEPKGYHVEVRRWSAVVTDAAHSGTATLTLDAPVTWNVVWIVADLRDGHYAIASTPGFPTMTPPRPRYRLKRDAAGAASRLGYSRPFVDGLYVEAGGAWIVRAGDGDARDADGKPDGETTIDLLQATPVSAGSQPPHSFHPGGTLLVVDVSRLDVLTVSIDAPLIAGAQ